MKDASGGSTTSLAAQLGAYGGPDAIKLVPINRPTPAPTQVVVRVEAAGLNPIDHKVRAGYLKDYFELPLPTILGVELAGVVVQVGSQVKSLHVGDRVMGSLGGEAGFGAYSQYVAISEDRVCQTPNDLTSVQAGSIPAAALTAWGALRAAGEIKRGQKILIHGAAGGVGGYAVQFAVAAGAEVYGTASASSVKHVLSRGAKRVFDRSERPEDHLDKLDLVLDLVGDNSLDRFWPLLVPNGAIVSIAAPDIAGRTKGGARGIWHTMVMDKARLREIAVAVASGQLKSTIAEIFAFDDLPAAIERVGTGHPPGKLVAVFT
jgi:NADPH:quinone reductase-like Zn-dependent oxidoreductase